jgi:hypothetical protein
MMMMMMMTVATMTYMVMVVVQIFQTADAHGEKQQIKPENREGTMTKWPAINGNLCQFIAVKV